MQLSSLVLLAVLVPLVAAKKAPKVKRNPQDVVAFADFPKGTIIFSAQKGGAVGVHVDITGLPPTGGPFQYHIHQHLVGPDGSCGDVGYHFNPYNGNANCDSQKNNAYCEVGDLSGKHGWINSTCFETKYKDPFLSLNKKSKSYVVGKSIVLHLADETKFACANIELASPDKLQYLMREVNKKGTVEVLAEPIEEDNEFDEDFQDADGDDSDSEPLDHVKSIGNYNETTSRDHWENIKKNKSNMTHFQPQGVSTDCENGAPGTAYGFTTCLAILAGLLF